MNTFQKIIFLLLIISLSASDLLGQTRLASSSILVSGSKTKFIPQDSGGVISVEFTNSRYECTIGPVDSVTFGQIFNLTNDTLYIAFKRTQILPDETWLTLVRLGSLIYSEVVDSLPWSSEEPCILLPRDSCPFGLYIYHFDDSDYKLDYSKDSLIVNLKLWAWGRTADTIRYSTIGRPVSGSSSVNRLELSEKPGLSITIFPNPVTNNAFQVNASGEIGAIQLYCIRDILGKVVRSGQISQTYSSSNNTFEITSLHTLQDGIYFLQIKSLEGIIASSQFTIIH